MNDASDIMVVKLSTGEMLVASYKTIQDSTPRAILENPVQFDILHSKDGSGSATLLATKWLQTDRKVFTVPLHHIVTTAEPNSIILEHYNESLDEMAALENEEDIEVEHLDSSTNTFH